MRHRESRGLVDTRESGHEDEMTVGFREASVGRADDGQIAVGRREQNKLDKLQRIKAAARSVFISKGYDDATAREIAVRAKVGLGTIFLYAADKRDLLFLVVNDDFEEVGRKAAAAVSDDESFLENLLNAFGCLYNFFGKNPELSRFLLREMFFYERGAQAERLSKTRERMIETVVRIVQLAKRRHELSSGTEIELAGRALFSVYQLEVRIWLSRKKLSRSEGLARLEKSLVTIAVGFAPTSAALRRRSKKL